MPAIITSQNSFEFKVHEFCVDASEIGLPPGTWPETLETDLGNKLNFMRTSGRRLPCGGARYMQVCGCITLDVFND